MRDDGAPVGLLVTRLAVPWMMLAVLELGLSACIPETGLRNSQVPIVARAGFAAYGLLVLLAAVCVLGYPLALFGRVLGRRGPHALHWLIGSARFLVVWMAVLLYGASWAIFWNTGVFLDREGLAFWAPHPVQVFHWVYPSLAIGVLAATLVVAAVVGAWAPRWAARRPPSVQRRLVVMAGAAVGICLVAAFSGRLAYGWADLDQSTSPFAVTRPVHAGPLVHALNDLQRRPLPPPAPSAVTASSPRVIRRPIVSMAQYLAGVAPRTSRRWNVVMVQVESLRSDQLRVYGGTREVMPTLDALARESRVFTKAYIQASHSNYADLVPLSSHYPLRAREMHTYPENPTYPRVLIYDVLKALGYKTGIFSSQNERWGGMINYHRPGNLDRFFHAATFSGPTYTPWEDVGFADWVKQTGGAGSVDDRYTVGEAMQWLETIGDSPFFLHMNLQSSHVPYVVPADFPHRYSPKQLDFTIMWGKFPKEKVDVVKDRYADSLFYADTQIGRLFAHLRQLGLWENTVVVVGGDNGEAFYEHGFAAHASWLFDEVMKVPMLIRAPGLTPGLDDRPAMFLDIPPSVFALLGLPSHPSFQGISLFEPRFNPDRSLYMIVQTPSAYESAIVRSGYKLHFSEGEGTYFLNDLVHDPGETTDIAPGRPDLIADLAGRLRRWRDEQLAYYGDPSRHTREYPPVLED
jgi:arylsulfatase A-like enzyme